MFTDDLRAFSRKVVGDEKNPYRIVQKLFAAVDEIPWAGAREYSTISNISDYALHAGHADCGQQTLRSEEHTSELQSLMRISYAVFCLKKKKITYNRHAQTHD